jgi:hypothetical protein
VKVSKRHERVIAATEEQLVGLIFDFDAVWPTEIAPAPRELGDRLYKVGPMIWEEFERPGAIRAFRVIRPAGMAGQHWFEGHTVDDGILVRHTLDGEAVGEGEAFWRETVEPVHDIILERIFDKIEAAVA